MSAPVHLRQLLCVTLFCLSQAPGIAWAEVETQEPEGAELSVREESPLSATFASHFFLTTGLGLGHQVFDNLTEARVFLGSAVETGWGVQAPECVTHPAYALGARRYLNTDRLTLYYGANLYYLKGGFRPSVDARIAFEANAGAHWQARSGFIFALGYAVFLFDGEEDGLNLQEQDWVTMEIGTSF